MAEPLDVVGRLGADNPNPPTNAELDQAADDLRDALDAATTAETPDLDLAKDLRAALDQVRAAQVEREEALEAQRAEARALRDGIFDEAEADAENEPSEDAEAEADAEVEDKQPEPVAASSTDIIARLKAHAARKAPAEEPKTIMSGTTVRAIGPAAGFEVEDGDFGSLGQLFSTHAKSVMGDGRSEKMFRLSRSYPENRQLGYNVNLNNKLLAEVYGYGRESRPQTAAGGLCGPGEVDHSHPICSDRGRPVRDSLPQFQASRGTVTFAPSASIGELSGAVSIWTAETDAAVATGATDTKPCPRVECPEEVSYTVDAITRCLTVGNFQAKFSPEFWASRLELLMAEFDRIAEQKALEEIALASTDVGPVDEGNTLNSFLAVINNVISGDRVANRNLSGGYVVVADAYIRDQIRNQVIKNLGVANNVEALQIADSQINGWLADVGARAVWTYDGTYDVAADSHRLITPTTAPTEAGVLVYSEDAFLFLDGGTIDLGTSITDSALNATNDRQAFAESFEKVAFRGCGAYRAEIALAAFCGCSPVA